MCQTVLGDLAANWDFHSAWYRDHLVQNIELLEQLHFGLTGPIIHMYYVHELVDILNPHLVFFENRRREKMKP